MIRVSALVVSQVASLDRLGRQLDDATERYEQALAIFERTGDQISAAFALRSLAQVKLELGEHGQAKNLLAAALRLARAARCGRVETQVLHRLGEAHLMTGEPEQAIVAFESALAIIRDLGDPRGGLRLAGPRYRESTARSAGGGPRRAAPRPGTRR